MKSPSKKNLLKLGGAAIFLITLGLNITLSTARDANSKQSAVSLESVQAFGDTGTCCPESGSLCQIGSTRATDAYYKTSGSCKSN